VVSQPPYSWLRRDVEAEHLPACRELGIAVTPYQPLQGGLLTGKYRPGAAPPAASRAAENPGWLAVSEDLYPRLEQFEREARAAGLSPGRYAVRWLLDQVGVTSVVAGVKGVEQLEDLIAACPPEW
jgi:aryl-alcohol dehydrogenase-like predicted oxidoreductase